MSINEYIADKRKIQSAILSFINEEEDPETKYHEISTLLTDPNLSKNKEELKQVILIISSISDNHHRTSNFFDKIGRIIEPIKDDLKNNFTNQELFTFFKNNKRTLLQLANENIITINDSLFSSNDPLMEQIADYFSPEIGEFENVGFSESIEKFKEYREKGQNMSYICELIRQDSVEEFIIYVSKTNISLSSEIEESIFETNSFLINNNPNLIEYAAFFGAIQIFKYIQINRPDLLNGNLWIYAIHSNNAEMIQILEGNHISPKDLTYEECMIESIKCHHNEICNYIRDFLFDKSKLSENEVEEDDYESEIQKDELKINKSPLIYHNFEFIPDDFESIFKLIFCLIENEYSTLVKLVNDQTQFFFDIKNYQYVKCVEDSYFYSYIVRDKMTLEHFLIKTFRSPRNFAEFSKTMICRYPSILKIKGFSQIDIDNKKNPSILTDCFRITLFDYINSKIKRTGIYTKTNDYIIILGISIGLRYLHKNGIIHEFLYPGSILLDDNLYPIIQNIELTRRLSLELGDHDYQEFRDSLYYASPEQVQGYNFHTSNVFSFSFILYHLLTLKHPCGEISKYSLYRILHRIAQGCRPRLGGIDNEVISEFLEKCWNQDPKERLTFDVILDFITKEEFYSYFEPLEHDSVKKYLDEYGNEFDEIKKRFE